MTVKNGKIPGGLTPEEKLAKKVVQETGHVGFNTHLFAQSLIVYGGPPMEPVLLGLVKAIIAGYADRHDVGFQTKTTREASRLRG